MISVIFMGILDARPL